MAGKRSRPQDYLDDEDVSPETSDTRDETSFVADRCSAELIEKASHISEGKTESKSESRSDEMIESMIERKGVADLTKPGAWGRYAHAAIQDEVAEANPEAEVEKGVARFRDDGSTGRGRVDVMSEGSVLEIKTHKLEKMSDHELVRFLDKTARQIESYQWSPSIEGKPDASAFFEFAPTSSERREFVERFLERRGIKTLWGDE